MYAIYVESSDSYVKDITAITSGGNDGMTSWNSTLDDITTFQTKEDAHDFMEQYDIVGEVVRIDELSFENCPKVVSDIFAKYGDDLDYDDLALILEECQAVGYTFEYYLDCVPFNIQKWSKS